MNFEENVIKSVIDIVTLCSEENIGLEKENKKLSGKDNWETLYVIPLMTLVGLIIAKIQHICPKERLTVILQMKVLIYLQFGK